MEGLTSRGRKQEKKNDDLLNWKESKKKKEVEKDAADESSLETTD
jgi:hypothetical protein